MSVDFAGGIGPILAEVGDVLVFYFGPANHTVHLMSGEKCNFDGGTLLELNWHRNFTKFEKS